MSDDKAIPQSWSWVRGTLKDPDGNTVLTTQSVSVRHAQHVLNALDAYARDREEVAELQAQLRNSVPRTRWEATDKQWFDERNRREELERKATAEIERLEHSVKHLAQSTSGLLTRAENAEAEVAREREIRERLAASLRELIDSPNAKANNMWDRARAALAEFDTK